MMMTRILSFAIASLTVFPALAHHPDKEENTLVAMLDHLLEWDHLAIMAGVILACIIGYRWLKANKSNAVEIK
jgi:hydrogenase/urease accessory protein HupE